MSHCRNLLLAIAVFLSFGLAAVLVVDLVVGSGLWWVRVASASGTLAVSGGALALLLRSIRRNHQLAEAHFLSLCEIDVCSLSQAEGCNAPPPLPPGHPFHEVGHRIRKLLEECGRRTLELKHTRTAWEVRYRRAAAQVEQLMAVFSALAEPIVVVDGYGEIVLANRSAQKLFQLDAAEPETRVLVELIQCQELVDLMLATSRRKHPTDRTEDLQIPAPDGQTRWYRVTASKLAAPQPAAAATNLGSAASTQVKVVAVLREIGDQKALQKRNAEFVSAVSHEMKTPLAGIKAYAELLLDGDAEDRQTQEEFLNVINEQSDRLQRLVDNLLNLSRIEAGVVRVSKETRSLNELLEEALHVVQLAAEAKQIELVADLSPMYLRVLADHDMLLQAAINLLSNAIKYTPAEGTVTLRSRLEGEKVRFEVEDTGVGLSPEDCQRIFEPFYRVRKDEKMAAGTGLGLPLAKHIVENVHGGELTVESTLGQGSVFRVAMPTAGQLT